MSEPEPVYSMPVKMQILNHWTLALDGPDERTADARFPYAYPCMKALCGDSYISTTRKLPDEHRASAIAYIEVIISRLAAPLREAYANLLWHRFIEYWQDTGMMRLAMRAL